MTPVISVENAKLGRLMNFSLTPLKTCSAEACATCGKACYARKAYIQYPAVRTAWDTNTALAKNNIPDLEKGILQKVLKRNPSLFRIHVGGDFISKEYAEMWARIASKAKGTKFLAFTKRWDIIEGLKLPKNLKIVYSAWPGMDAPPSGKPIAWMDDGTDHRIPKNAHVCMGGHNGVTCNNCGKCWGLKTDVIFKKH